jgi:hypothetical protein
MVGPDANRFPRGACSKHSCGFSTLARSGTCCRKAIRTTKLCIVGFSLGATARFASSPDGCCQRTSRQRGAGRGRELHRRDLCDGQGGGTEIGPTKRGKGMKLMAIVDRHGLPLSVSTHAANHHEVRLVQLCCCLLWMLSISLRRDKYISASMA